MRRQHRDLVPIRVEFQQPEPDVLRYLEKVAAAWQKREQLGITPIEHRGSASLQDLSREIEELGKNTLLRKQAI